MCLTVVPVPPSPLPDRRPDGRARRPVRRLLTSALTTLLAAVTLVALPIAAPPSEATSRYLCTGYTACANAGYGHAGYASRNQTMYWRMYAGHNCTNYVAYRMIQRGMSTERPWTGSGNATNWGVARADLTDQTPKVGAVAWWRAGVAGAGSSGHVAYVEKVVSANEIVISEDSWSGDFHWRTIYNNGPGWPSGFIHFLDGPAEPPPAFTGDVPPSIEGTAQVGVRLTSYRGSFKPVGATRTSQWFVGGVPVEGATGTTYTPVAADKGKPITLQTTATRDGYVSAVATSKATDPVLPGALTKVANPVVDGFPEVAQVLTAKPGEWSPAPDEIEYRWRADGAWLGDEYDGPTLRLTRDLVGKKISVVEAGSKAGYTGQFNYSTQFGPVVAGVVEVTEPFTRTGESRYGASLTFARGTYSPGNASVSYRWFRDGVHVPEATGSTYPLTDADVGHVIKAKATIARERYQSAYTFAAYPLVTTPSKFSLIANGRKRGAIVRVRLTAPGHQPTGQVYARYGTRKVHGTLVDGTVDLVLDRLAPGKRTISIVYGGDGVAERLTTTRTVTVRS